MCYLEMHLDMNHIMWLTQKQPHDVFMEIWDELHREISFKIKQIKQWTLVEI
jgi:hypothetical protein